MTLRRTASLIQNVSFLEAVTLQYINVVVVTLQYINVVAVALQYIDVVVVTL